MNFATDTLPSSELRAFAAAVVHELRTPLAALTTEVDIALRRDRPPAAYREALARIRRRLAELAEFSGDLAWLGYPSAPSNQSATCRLDGLLASIAARASASITVEAAPHVELLGDEPLVARGVWLLVDHALRYRLGNARVRLAVLDEGPLHVAVGIIADRPGFAPGAWNAVLGGPEASGVSAGDLLRLSAAKRIVHEFGGIVAAAPADMDGLLVRLRRA